VLPGKNSAGLTEKEGDLNIIVDGVLLYETKVTSANE
jgi:hypothetical protein